MTFYSIEQRQLIKEVPHHVAIIPDGNRRWAKKRHMGATQGQKEGADILLDIVKAAKEVGVKVVTFYIFSTENWTRDQEEVQGLLWLLETYLKEKRPTMIENGVKLDSIGDLSRFPESVIHTLDETKKATMNCQDITMVLALNYGGRDEIKRAIVKLMDEYDKGFLQKESITEEKISHFLDTKKWKDPDLLIRTSGESRISNFLLWQVSYTELYTADVLWPDFSPGHLMEALLSYQRRDRRLGGA